MNRQTRLKLVAGLLSCLMPSACYPNESDERDRFVEKMGFISVGDTGARVLSILGRPDDTRTLEQEIRLADADSVWCYGTDGHMSFPTFGRVYFFKDRVQKTIGGPDGSLTGNALTSIEMRELLRIVSTARGVTGAEYDIRGMIRIVNSLQRLGKENAVKVLKEYARLCNRYDYHETEGIEIILRVLFEPPDDPGYMRALLPGTSGPFPENRREFPRFPVVIEEGIPFLINFPIFMGGPSQPLASSIQYFEESCQIRARPLTPGTEALAIPEHLPKKLGRENDRAVKALVIDQLTSLVQGREVHTTGLNKRTLDEAAASWEQLRDALKGTRLLWDPKKYAYVAVGQSEIAGGP